MKGWLMKPIPEGTVLPPAVEAAYSCLGTRRRIHDLDALNVMDDQVFRESTVKRFPNPSGSPRDWDGRKATLCMAHVLYGTDRLSLVGETMAAILLGAIASTEHTYGWTIQQEREDEGDPVPPAKLVPETGPELRYESRERHSIIEGWIGLPTLWMSPPRVISGMLSPRGLPLFSRSCTVPENGNKARIPTTEGADVTILMHIIRDVLYKMIERDPHMTAHKHHEAWHLANDMKRAKQSPLRMTSVDKSRATDTFDVELSMAIYDGLTRGQRSPEMRRALVALRPFMVTRRWYILPNWKDGHTTVSPKVARGAVNAWRHGYHRPQDLERLKAAEAGDPEAVQSLRDNPAQRDKHLAVRAYFRQEPSVRAVEPARVKACLPQGNPPSYSILCVWSRFETDAACYKDGIRSFLENPRPLMNIFRLIQGDDVIFASSKRRDQRLRTMCKMTGTIIGDGAHHTSTQFAVFCENVIVRAGDSGYWRAADIVLVKTFIGNNIRKNPKQPVGAKDPFLLRGTACAKQVVYAPRAQKQIADYCLWNTYRRYREELRDETFLRWRWVHVPDFLGGLGYPSLRSDKHIWRKRVPRVVKQIVANLLSDNESVQSAVRFISLNSVNSVNSKNMEEQYDDVLGLFDTVANTRQTRALIRDGDGVPVVQRRGEGSPDLGFLTHEDLIERSANSPVDEISSLATGTDVNGKPLTDRNSENRRNFRRSLSTLSNWMPFRELVRLCLRDASLRALLRGTKMTTPFFSYGSYMSARGKRISKAKQYLTNIRLRGTPPIRFRNFRHLSSRLYKQAGQLWVNRDHEWIKQLLAKVGELELGPPD